ncbi:MAG: hypothetical protein M1834_000262 [Cirrosporium novae-zelandiae]|nr:MAG: hypothetical protein M1834_000262 [Cirrosporium novae-zelandiae]
MDTLLTAEVAANSPRFRRKSSTFVDAIHDLPERFEMAPAQLYSTESGRLFHAGKIAIATVGLPARGKTYSYISRAGQVSPMVSDPVHIHVRIISVPIEYSRLGVKTRVFHLGDYRRATMPEGQDVPDDYFFVNASASSVLLRQKILRKCREDVYHFLDVENGQVAIYDAVNGLAAGRRSLAKEFAKHDVETLFIESNCDDEKIIEENVRSVKISSPDLINAGERVAVNNCSFGYLSHRIVFYLLNLHIKSRRTYFARAGTSREEDSYKVDAPLSDAGRDYARKLCEALTNHREQEHQAVVSRGGIETPTRPLTVWTSPRRRTVQTAEIFEENGYKVRQRTQMRQLNPGVCEKLSERRIRAQYPEEVTKHEADPYHHRYPRAESYHDLAVRLEPIILELEREKNDLLLIAHESVLRVLYGYLMACHASDIPSLQFPRNEIIEIIPASYQNEASRIPILGVPEEIIPGSPEDLKIPVPPSGTASPFPGLGSPLIRSGAVTPMHGKNVQEHIDVTRLRTESGLE